MTAEPQRSDACRSRSGKRVHYKITRVGRGDAPTPHPGTEHYGRVHHVGRRPGGAERAGRSRDREVERDDLDARVPEQPVQGDLLYCSGKTPGAELVPACAAFLLRRPT